MQAATICRFLFVGPALLVSAWGGDIASGEPATAPAAHPATAPSASTNPATVDVATSQAVAGLAGQLADADWRKRERALADLIRMGDAAVPALENLVRTTTVDEVRVAAQTALRQIGEDRVVGPSYVTLHLKDVAPRKAFEALAKQSFTQLKAFPEDLWEQAGQIKVNIDADRQPFWQVMQSLCRQTSLELTEVDGKMLITQNGGGSRITSRHAAVAGPFLIVPNQASLGRSVTYDADDPPVVEDFSLQLSAFPEPKLKVLRVTQSFKVLEAVDEKGNSLLPDAPADKKAAVVEDIDFNGQGVGDGSFMLSTQLKRPKQPGARLVRLRGTVGFRLQVESQNIEIRDLKSMKEVSRVVNGIRVVFHDLKKEQEQYHVRMTVHTDANVPGAWEDLEPMMVQRIRVFDAKGQALDSQGVGNFRGDDNKVEMSLMFTPSQRPEDGKQSGEPVRLVWEATTKTRDLVVPIELKDLKLP